MDFIKYKRILIMAYAYLGLGIIDIAALLIYSYFFPGELISSIPYAKTGLIAIVGFGIIWIVLFFAFLLSNNGKEFQKAYIKYNKNMKKKTP